jgi:transposase-like protein
MFVRACPKCTSYSVHRSRRRGFVERFLLPLTLRRPFRCENCNTRYNGYAYSTPVRVASPAAQPEAEGVKEGEAPGQR